MKSTKQLGAAFASLPQRPALEIARHDPFLFQILLGG
jgi:hypothetical protein